MSDPLFCPSCRSEFLASATRCVECDVALVSESALGAAAAEELPAVGALVCIRAASMGWAQGLSQRLAAAGISHRIEVAHDDEEDGSVRRPGHNLPYGVYVLPADVDAATAVDAAFTEYQIPDHPGAGASLEVSEDACPACGTEVAADVAECPECGIVLLMEEG